VKKMETHIFEQNWYCMNMSKSLDKNNNYTNTECQLKTIEGDNSNII